MIAPDDLSLSDAEVLEILARGDLEPLGLLPRSSNATILSRVRDGADELLAVYKPRAGESPLWDFPEGTLHRREVAAYVLATTLGWPRVPPTIERDGPHGVGSVQRFLPFDATRHYLTLADDPELDDTFRRVALFDAVANNADRKSGHCLVADDGELFVVDHGVCFHVEPKLRTVIWAYAGDPLRPDEREDLRRLADALRRGDAGERLAALIAQDEVAATIARAETLVDVGRFPRPGAERPYPWPPV